MAYGYVGEIRIFAGNFPPNGWAFCDGALLSISENSTLFTLIGTIYGGDGQTTFALPDLRGRVPIHQGSSGGSSFVIGQNGGSETVTLTTNQIPAHGHALQASTDQAGSATNPTNQVLAQTTPVKLYSVFAGTASLATQSIVNNGGNQSHENLQPYLGLNFILSLYGVYPSRS
jgi:microcystin-dependent protein